MSDTKEFEPTVSYDDDGRVTQKQTYDRDGNPDRTYKYSYTGNGETVEQSFDSKTGELGHEEVFDKNGNTLKEIFRRDGQVRSAYTHQYNDDGSLAETVAYENDNGSLRVKSQFFVEKDNVGREVYTSRSFDESGKPVRIERGYKGQGKEGVFLSLSEGEKGFGARHDEFFKGKDSWKAEEYLTQYAEIKPVHAEDANKNASEKVMGQDGSYHVVERTSDGVVLSDESFDKDGNMKAASYYKNGVLDSKTIYNEDGSKHSFFYEDDGSVRSEKFHSADGRSVSSIAHTSGMTTTELLDEQGRTTYSASYYNDGGKLYPWNEHSYEYDADGKKVADQGRSFGTAGEKGGKTSEELLASMQYKDKWLMKTFADRVSGRVTAEEAQKTSDARPQSKDGQMADAQDKAKPAEKKTVQNDVKTPAPEKKPAARTTTLPSVRGNAMPERAKAAEAEKKPAARTTTLPSVRGNAMPERAKAAEAVKENAAQTTLPSVRGNAMPERAKTADYENAVADSFVNLSKQNSQGNVQALFNDMQNLMRDYRSQGLTAKDIQQKMQAVMSAAYDKGIAQGLNADLLKNNIARFSEGFNKEAERESAERPATVMAAETRDGKPDFSDAEYVDYEEVPNTAKVAEAEENTANAKVDDVRSDESKGVHVDDARADEGNAADTHDVNGDNGKDNGGNDSVPPAGSVNDEKAAGPADGAFSFGEKDGNVNENDGNADVNGNASGNANSGDLLSQMMDTAFKNRYMMVEDVYNDPDHICPFGQLNSNTVKDHSDDKDDPHVSMLLDTGATLINRPNRVHVKYTTKVTYDENGNEVRSPQVSFKDCMAAVRLGMEKGWTSATLNGPDAYKEQMYLAMRAMGMKVVGYQPSADLKAQGDELAAQYLADRRQADLTDKRYPDIQKLCKDNGVSKPEQIGEKFVDKMDKNGKRYDPASEELALTKDGNYTVTTYQNKGEENESKTTVTYGFGGKVLSVANAQNNRDANTSDGNDNADKGANTSDGNDKADKGVNTSDGNDKADKGDKTADAGSNAKGAEENVEQPQPVNESAGEKTQFRPTPEKNAEAATALPAVIEKDGKANEAPEQVPPVKGAEKNLPVPVTPRVKAQLALEAAGATTALAKTDPVKAQQMATQVATTKGIANQLQVVGQIANQAKGNNTQLALTQHRQQETAIVLASQKNKTK